MLTQGVIMLVAGMWILFMMYIITAHSFFSLLVFKLFPTLVGLASLYHGAKILHFI